MPRPNHLSHFFELPEIAGGYPLPPYFNLVIPVGEDRTNLIDNPSFEISTSNWSGTNMSLVISTQQQYVGAYSLDCFPSSPTGNVFYGNTTALSLTIDVIYAVSFRFLGLVGGLPYDAYIATTGGVRLAGLTFKSTGFWQWVTFLYKETSTNSRRLYISANGNAANSREFFIDAVQVEVTSAGKRYPTTYIDGDQIGLTPNESPLPYYWNGAPHSSTSVRSGLTRSGGRVVNLQDLGLTISTVAGLALPVPQVVSLPFGQLDGEQYQRTRKEAREFTIAGRVIGRSAVQLDQLFGSLSRELDRDAFSRDEPLILKYQPLDEQEQIIGPELDIVVTYTGGLEGQRNNLNTEIFTATFKQHTSNLIGHSGGSAMNFSSNLSNANAIVRRSPSGAWSAVDTGVSAGATTAVWVITRSPLSGLIYIGGDFTNAGSSGADYAAVYNPITNVLSVIKAATSFNGIVIDIVVAPNGDVYFGGNFTNVDGIANADGIVKYTPSTNTFAALGTGVAANSVWTMVFDSVGNLYAGGDFTGMGGVANTAGIAKWNGSAWSAMGTGVPGGAPGNAVLALASNKLDIYAGGSFLNMDGIAAADRLAKWNGTTSTWSEMITGANDQVSALVFGPDGNLYIGGAFETLSGISAVAIGKWNGISFSPVGSATALAAANLVDDIIFAADGTMYISGLFNTVFGSGFPSAIAKFDGSNFLPVGIDLPGSGEDVICMELSPSGDIYFGFNTTGTAVVATITTITNDGSSHTFPVISITGSTSSRIYHVINLTTNKAIYLNYTIQNGEILTFNLNPLNLSFRSSMYGNISSSIMSGSDEANFYLSRGSNSISVLTSASVSMSMYWPECFLSIHDVVGKI